MGTLLPPDLNEHNPINSHPCQAVFTSLYTPADTFLTQIQVWRYLFTAISQFDRRQITDNCSGVADLL